MDEETTTRTMLAMTSPLYLESVKAMLAELGEAADITAAATGKLALREQQLLMSPAAARDLERRAMREQAASLLEEAATLMRAQNVAKATEGVQALLEYCGRLSSFAAAAASGRGDAAEEAAAGALFSSLEPPAPLKQSEVLSMYRVYLLSCLDDLKIDDAKAAMLAQLSQVLSLSESQCASLYEAAAGPLFRKLVQQVVGSDLGAEQKASLQGKIADLGLPPAVVISISAEVYGTKLEEVAGDGKIMKTEDEATLAELREFLGLSKEQVYDAHARVCSDTYRKSVNEVMGVAGRIPDEYFEGLEKLQTRLGLSDQTAQELYVESAKAKMKTFGQAAMTQLEEKIKAEQAGGKDKKKEEGSMAIDENAVSGEVLKLVDFARAARVLVEKTIEVEEDGKTVQKDVEVIGTSLKGDFSSKALKELYRQYLSEALSGSQSDANNLNRLALVLGLDESDVAAIHLELGSLIYRRYLAKSFSQAGALGERERSQLDSIKDALDLEQAKTDALIREAECNYVSDRLSAMFDNSQVNAEKVREVRDAAERLDVSLQADLEVSPTRLEKMFEVDLEDLIESGELTVADLGALEEICESLHVSEERASVMLQASITRRCNEGTLQAISLMRQGATAAMLDEVNTVLKYAAISPSEVELSAVGAAEKSELYMLYQANALTEGADDIEAVARLEVLKTLVGI